MISTRAVFRRLSVDLAPTSGSMETQQKVVVSDGGKRKWISAEGLSVQLEKKGAVRTYFRRRTRPRVASLALQGPRPTWVSSISSPLDPSAAWATFFVAYAVTSWTSLSLELTRMIPFISDWLRRHCSRDAKDEFHTSIPYYSEIPRLLLFGLIGLVYFLLAPLILPFILIFFCVGYIIFRNQLLNVYLPKYETGGQFWPTVHNSTIFALILMQAILIGIFVLKKLPLASSLVLPLPVLTLLFNEYCRKRFLPIFHKFSAETLIKKDRENQNDPDFIENYHKLVGAYRDPALTPISDTVTINEQTGPLLSSTEG